MRDGAGWRGERAELALTYLALSQSGMLSSDGECYAFDERANGLVPGEAVAAVVLKRESQARGDGDAIYGVIRASGMNYDGRTNGITAPSGLAQRQLIVDVLRRGGIDAGQVGYVLGHSVGSPMGDPIEAQALGEALQGGHCVLGSIKPLIGHTFAASGVVSLIGMCLALKHRRMPGTANYRQANAYIDAANGPLRIEPAAQPWEGRGRHGLVGATGMSGTNVLVLLGEGEPEAAAERDGEALLVLSAREEAVLRRYAEKLRGYLQREPGSGLADVAR
ncbi:beta-ketoacyl synthase N-terminal-like domain-containing protein, partial [Chromobacterium sphagni]|uniref:beta-ketoacyl synthase N-terminal-like domain-containing protein n=1 Tax=Chromobacterium sphagni TaxID=1903179 RepID=UPI001113F752